MGQIMPQRICGDEDLGFRERGDGDGVVFGVDLVVQEERCWVGVGGAEDVPVVWGLGVRAEGLCRPD